MSFLTRFTSAFRLLFRKRQLDQELDDEVWPNPDSNLGNPSARARETRWRGFNFSRYIKKAAAWRSQEFMHGAESFIAVFWGTHKAVECSN